MDDIEERLRSHAQAFDGLLSLIPAKYYYGEDGSDQWQQKKQTKEQAREAKRAKLDPESAKTAKDVMDENARKRKREDGKTAEDEDPDEDLGSELPKEGMNRGESKPKKQKQPEDQDQSKTPDEIEKAEARKKAKEEKEEKKALKKAAQKEKKKAKEFARKDRIQGQNKRDGEPTKEAKPNSTKPVEKPDQEVAGDDEAEEDAGERISFDFNPDQTQSSNSSAPNSPEFDAPNGQSGSSSISSIVPPTDTDKPTEPKPLKPTPEELKQRLQKRLDELRAARHADGFDGKPARNRQELIEARRQKAEQRKMHKKELRQKAREEEQRVKDDAMARRFSPGGSGSLLASPRSPADSIGSNNNYSFGRMVFTDGQQTDAGLSNLRDQPKRQGPQDAASALRAAETKGSRLAGYDAEKRADIEEKDMWLNAKKRAHGERVRDDTSLLKKALKRKESAKKKSEREWKERADAVKKGKEAKQSKREENLRKRRDEKGGNKGGKGKKARPGFEGSFKSGKR